MPKVSKHPLPEIATQIEKYASVGIGLEAISKLIGISPDTISRNYNDNYQNAIQKANGAIAGALYNKAMNGDTTAMIFWLKTRARWKETSHHEISGLDGSKLEWVVKLKK